MTRRRVNGDPATRIAAYSLVTEAGCHEWTGSLTYDGYGRTSVNGVDCRAHRLAYELQHGPIPDGLVLDHLCSNRRCVRVDHLEAVPQGVNLARSPLTTVGRSLAGVCKNGHDVTGSNGHVALATGARGCRICDRARDRARAAERAA